MSGLRNIQVFSTMWRISLRKLSSWPHQRRKTRTSCRLSTETSGPESKFIALVYVLEIDFSSVVLPDAAIKEGTKIPVFVVDWEMTQLGLPSVDFGEMITEMYALWLYKSIDAGLWMMEGFIEGYGHISEEFAFRTAIHVGTHLVCVTTDFPAWGRENYERVVAAGKDIIVHAWKKDREWFEEGDLACLFRSEN